MGDLTTNHTGDAHEWFVAARADPSSPEAGFYFFDEHPDRYASWLGVASLPKLDQSSPELRRRLYDGPGSVVARWLEAGLDAWRIDVANMTGRHGAQDLAHDVARTLVATARAARPDVWVLAEHGHDATGDLRGDGWHGTMDYAGFTRPVWTWLAAGETSAAASSARRPRHRACRPRRWSPPCARSTPRCRGALGPPRRCTSTRTTSPASAPRSGVAARAGSRRRAATATSPVSPCR
jgi:glycosidase